MLHYGDRCFCREEGGADLGRCCEEASGVEEAVDEV